jgi:hypothetical protein
VAIAQPLVAENGNTTPLIEVVHLMVIEALLIGLAVPREVIHLAIGNAQRKETLADRVAILEVNVAIAAALVIVEVSVIAAALAIVVVSVIAAALAIVAVSAIVVELVIAAELGIVVELAIVAAWEIVAEPGIAAARE